MGGWPGLQGGFGGAHPLAWRRRLQLALATIWLLDGVLQLQPFMFAAGSRGFSGMLRGVAGGNPAWVARSINWVSAMDNHHAVLADLFFAGIQILIGLGIAYRRTLEPALVVSVVWSLGVWWFGEGLGGVLHGGGSPLGGGPGAVLFYALLAVLLWPARREDEAPFAAAAAVGAPVARAVWAGIWLLLAALALLGAGRSPGGARAQITLVDVGQPAWLGHLDRLAASASGGNGIVIGVVLACLAVVVATAPYLPLRWSRAALVLAMALAAAIWVVFENFGGILAGGATDPNSGPLIALLALAYWPRPALATTAAAAVTTEPVAASVDARVRVAAS